MMKEVIKYYEKNRNNINLALVLLIVLPPLFFQITKLPINLWDESRLAISAYEMYKTGNYLIVTFGFEPDMWSVKPPLMIWLQCFCMYIFGVGELAIRLPTVLAASGLLIAIIYFSKNYLKFNLLGYVAAFVLISTWGFMELHVVRTGDYDVVLIFFMMLGVFFIYNYITFGDTKWLYLFFASLIFGALTKGIAALLFIPGIGIYILWKRSLMKVLGNKHFYLGVFLFLFFVLGYYLLRENYNPGYIAAVFEQELGGRFAKGLGVHVYPFPFYFENMLKFQYSAWYLLAFGGILMSFIRNKNSKLAEFMVLISCIVITFFLIISIAKTKLEWYNAPLYPLLAFLTASFLINILEILLNNTWLNQNVKIELLPYAFLAFIFLIPYKNIWQKLVDKSYHGLEIHKMELGLFLKDILHKDKALNADYLADNTYNPHITFYMHALREKGKKIEFIDFNKMVGGESLIVFDPGIKEFIHSKYDYDVIEEKGMVKVIKIKGAREN